MKTRHQFNSESPRQVKGNNLALTRRDVIKSAGAAAIGLSATGVFYDREKTANWPKVPLELLADKQIR